ncbi:hypothetical protein [Bacillus multifaciens]|uniref:hypothetical protein n=1 Tax=Bacillus multifaciens TaxID=3068506 RepID=UPI0027410451|nr:hypothetical protein [Bacillus sp. WLY-B-L8]MDP7979871.1 hypothetical protein [Bacillus sp. WLY-B-L8]
MYVGRDMTELSMTPKDQWNQEELAYFHHSLQQMMPYLNVEGQTIYKEVVKEIEARGGLQRQQADWMHSTEIPHD